MIENFKTLPGIGGKTAERLAFSMLDFDKNNLTNFANAILEVRDKITYCHLCGNISDNELCSVCSNSERDFSTIFVVEKPKDIILFEKLGVYKGIYHVLNGLISPLDGIGPDEIAIASLLKRVEQEPIGEVILALKPSIEGETTALYISKLFENYPVLITKIAHGVPLGTDMEYIDAMTLEMSLEERKEFS